MKSSQSYRWVGVRILPLLRESKIIVIMQSTHAVYVDESAGARQCKILLLSACIQTYPVWAKFSDDWDRVLHEYPAVSGFHVREARARIKEFSRWKAIDVDRKIIALTEVIAQHEPHIVSCWMSETDYAETVRVASPSDLRNAYFTCFGAIVIKVAQYQQYLGITTPADFIFDEHGDIGNEALMWHFAFKEGQPKEIQNIMGSTPIFGDDRDFLPLQAADLIAWHKRRRKEFPGLDPEVAASMRIDDLPGAEVEITRKALESIAAKNSQVPGVMEAMNAPSCYKQLKSDYRKMKRRHK
jgi:hypothetical protein